MGSPEQHAVTCASRRGKACNCQVRHRLREAEARRMAYNARFAELILIECRLDPEWEYRVHLILSMEA